MGGRRARPTGREPAPYPARRRRAPWRILMDQIVQVLGSLLVLTAFVAAQRRWLSPESRAYLALNLVGAGILAVLAAHKGQYGLLLLEFCWAVVAGAALVRG